MKKISCIVPCYNEEASLPYFYDELTRVIHLMKQTSELEFEIVFVNSLLM